MDNFQNLVNSVWDFFREGFQNVNAVEGLIIALIATVLLSSWARLLILAIGATIVHLIADILIPVIANHAQFQLPKDLMEVSYWHHALVLFVGYIVVIAVFFFIKRLFFRGGH